VTIEACSVLDFWFAGDPSTHHDKWFKKNPDFDAACARFTRDVRAARDGAHDHWAETPRGALALIILLDQLSRNIFRGSAEAFAADPKALDIAGRTVARGFDATLTTPERMFVYLPFQHAEIIAAQDESVRLFETLRGELADSSIDYADSHRTVIRQFGRFPHRNAVLGRSNTAEEDAYLAQPGAGF
jgi:uncharacterized protein (DUF924 family)